MSSRRLWIISELFYPEQTSTGYFLSEIARGLALNWDVQVICSQPTYSERGVTAPAIESWEGVSIHRLRGSRFDKDRLALRLVNVLTFTLSCLLFTSWRVRRGDAVLVVTNPPTIFPLVGFIARLKKAKSILLVHDVYPDVLSVTGYLSTKSFIYRAFDRLIGWSSRKYDRIVVLGRDMLSKLLDKSGLPLSRIAIIPNWGDTEAVRPIARSDNAFAKVHGMADTFNVQFSGNIGRTHDIETLLSAASLTREQQHVHYWFIGYGGKAALLEHDEARGLANVHALPRQSREDLGPMLSSADVIVIAFIPGMAGISVPSRMYNVMAAGTPIIALAEPESELAIVVREFDCGWVIAPGDGSALAELVMWLSTPEGMLEVSKKGGAARQAACECYTLDAVLTGYRTLLDQLFEENLMG